MPPDYIDSSFHELLNEQEELKISVRNFQNLMIEVCKYHTIHGCWVVSLEPNIRVHVCCTICNQDVKFGDLLIVTSLIYQSQLS